MLGKVLEVREMGKSALKAIDVEQSPRPPGAWPFFEGCYVMRLRPWQVRSWGQGAPWAVPRSRPREVGKVVIRPGKGCDILLYG